MALEKIHASMVEQLGDSFNVQQKDLGEATLTASNADVYTVPADTRTIVWSILVSNTDSSSRDVTCTLSDATAGPTEYKLAHEVPIGVGSALELLKKPKVLETGDKIRALGSAANVLDMTIVGVELSADTEHFNAGVNLTGTGLTTLFTGTGSGQMIESLLVANDGTVSANATATWTTNSGGLLIDWVKDLSIPANSTVEILESPKAIASGDTIQVQSSVANTLDWVLAGRDK